MFGRAWRPTHARRRSSPLMPRQIKLDRCALPQFAVDRDMAVRLPRKSIDHRKPKSGALPDRLGGKERIEGARRHLRAHAGAGVGDADADIIAGRKRRRIRGHAVEPRIRGRDGELAAIGHGVARVDGEIEQRAFQLIGIAQRAPQIVRRDDRKIDGLADGPAQQILQRHHELIGIDAFRNQRLPPRKGQQAMGERGGAVGRCHRRVDVARDIVGAPLIETGLQQIQRSDDSRQQIVEVVRDAAGQLPHRFHLLGLQQGLLGGLQPFGRGLLRGDVAGDRIDVIPVGHAGPRQPAVGSVLVAKAAFEPDGGFGRRRAS